MIRRWLKTVGCALLLLPGAAAGQTQGTVKWTDAGDAFSATYRRSNGTTQTVLAGDAYRAQFRINGSYPYLPPHGTGTAFGPAVDIYCIDFLHTAKTGTAGYTAYFTQLGSQPLTYTRSSDLNRYLQVAWLAQEMESVLFPLDNSERYQRAAIHGAMWQIMSGQPVAVSAAGYAMASNAISYWVNQALANFHEVDASRWTVVTDACVFNSGTAGAGGAAADGCGQEFLTRTVTPEPGTILLMATGFLVLLGLARLVPPPSLA